MTSPTTTRRFLLIIAALIFVSTHTLAGPLIRVTPSTATPTLGSTFEVDLIGEDFVDLYAYNFTLTFDPALVRAVSVAEGALLATAGTTFFIAGAIDNTSGIVSFTGNTLLGAIGGASGDGSLAIFGFEAISEGLSLLSLTDLLFLDSGLADIAFVTEEALVTVVAANPAPVPEPATLPLLLLAFGTVAVLRPRHAGECGPKNRA